MTARPVNTVTTEIVINGIGVKISVDLFDPTEKLGDIWIRKLIQKLPEEQVGNLRETVGQFLPATAQAIGEDVLRFFQEAFDQDELPHIQEDDRAETEIPGFLRQTT